MTNQLNLYLFGFFPIVLVLSVSLCAMGQSRMDSLASQIDAHFDNNSFEQAIPLLLQSLDIAKDSADLRRVFADLGYAHHLANEFEKSLTYYLQAVEIAQYMGDSLRSARFIRSVGLNHQRMGLYALALDKYQDALQWVKGVEKYAGMEAEIYNSMGLLYQQLNNPETGLLVMKDAQSIWMMLGDTTNLGKIWTNMAICFDDMKAYDSALHYNIRALDLKKHSGNPSEIVSTLNNISVNLLNQGKVDEAFPYLEESYQLHLLLNDKEGLAISYKNLADHALRKNRYIQSEAYLDSALTILRSIGSKDYLIEALELQLKLWETTGQYAKGLATYKMWDSLKTEMFLEEKFKVQEIGNMYLLREKELENEQVAQRANLLEVKNIQIRNTSILIGIIGLLAIAFAVASSRNLRVEKRQSEYISHQNTIIKGQQDELRHRTSNSLARTNGIVNLIARKITDEEVREKLLNASRILVTAAALERHLIGVENEKEVRLGEFIESVIEHQRQAVQLETRKIQIDLTCENEIYLPVDQVIHTAIILNEWITNSLKYGFTDYAQGRINVKIQQEKSSISIDYRDDGSGLSPSSNAGTGSRLNELFLRELKGILTTTSDDGISHLLRFPIKASKKHLFNHKQQNV